MQHDDTWSALEVQVMSVLFAAGLFIVAVEDNRGHQQVCHDDGAGGGDVDLPGGGLSSQQLQGCILRVTIYIICNMCII